MSLTNVYTIVNGQLPEFFKKIQDGQAPENFSQQHLKDIGFTSSNHRSYIQILKALGFLTPEGAPTQRYHDYRNRSMCKKVLGSAIQEAYGDLFVIKEKPTANDKDLIQGKFKSAFNTTDSVADRQTKTFLALLDMADLNCQQSPTNTVGKKQLEQQPENRDHQARENLVQTTKDSQIKAPSLHYNIEIHLPATKDIEVYNAIFKSIKEHLFE